MIDESKARGLQAMYQAGATGALQPLEEACTAIAFRIARHSHRLPRERAEEVAHDAAAKLMERYLAEPGFRVRSFSAMLGYRVRDLVVISPRQRQRTFEDRLVLSAKTLDTEQLDITPGEVLVMPGGDALADLVDSHPKGKKAAADLCRSRSYRQAVRRIEAYVGRRWIYDHAAELHAVYRALHWKEGANGRLRRSGLEAVRRALLQGKRDERKQAAQ